MVAATATLAVMAVVAATEAAVVISDMLWRVRQCKL
jgi:hypothetical protein